jgi:hypothetical protein
MLFHPGDDANVGKAERPAAFEDKAKFWAVFFFMLGRILGVAVGARRQNTKEKQQLRGSDLHAYPLSLRFVNSPLSAPESPLDAKEPSDVW